MDLTIDITTVLHQMQTRMDKLEEENAALKNRITEIEGKQAPPDLEQRIAALETNSTDTIAKINVLRENGYAGRKIVNTPEILELVLLGLPFHDRRLFLSKFTYVSRQFRDIIKSSKPIRDAMFLATPASQPNILGIMPPTATAAEMDQRVVPSPLFRRDRFQRYAQRGTFGGHLFEFGRRPGGLPYIYIDLTSGADVTYDDSSADALLWAPMPAVKLVVVFKKATESYKRQQHLSYDSVSQTTKSYTRLLYTGIDKNDFVFNVDAVSLTLGDHFRVAEEMVRGHPQAVVQREAIPWVSPSMDRICYSDEAAAAMMLSEPVYHPRRD